MNQSIKDNQKDYHFSIWERLTLPSPSFFNRVKAIGLALIALSAGLMKLEVINESITTILATTGTVMTLVSQFSVDVNKSEEQGKL